jgi:hypothetical protein
MSVGANELAGARNVLLYPGLPSFAMRLPLALDLAQVGTLRLL